MQLIDVHCHLESDFFSDTLDEIIKGAKQAGIVKLITSTTGPSEWDQSRSIAKQFTEVEFALGIHPWYISFSDLDKIEELKNAKANGAVAIGEVGLDKKIENPSFDTQQLFFQKQLTIAQELGLPVVVHCRGAFNELIAIIKKTDMAGRGGVIHNYTGSAEIARELINYNFMFSIGGTLTYKLSKKRTKLLKEIYPDRFLLETDSPDIVPFPLHGKPNVPANIVYNLNAAAKILEVPPEEIAFHTTKNAVELFGLEI